MAGITIFDDLQDPYQLKNIDYRTCPELFESLWNQLNEKLAEANDIWHRDRILEKLNILLTESKGETKVKESDIPIHPEMETKEQGEMAAAEKIL